MLGGIQSSNRVYQCQICTALFFQWFEHCPRCGQADRLRIRENRGARIREHIVVAGTRGDAAEYRRRMNVPIFDELSGGFPPGTVTLVSGDEGSGKSTLLALAACLADCPRTLYCAGEERMQAVDERIHRLGLSELNARSQRCAIFHSNMTEEIFVAAESWQPTVMIVDSQQAFASPTKKTNQGTISQIKFLIKLLIAYAKRTDCIIFVVGQLNAQRRVAGPSNVKFDVSAHITIRRDERTGLRTVKFLKSRYCDTHQEKKFTFNERGDVVVMRDDRKRRNMDGAVFTPPAVALSGEEPADRLYVPGAEPLDEQGLAEALLVEEPPKPKKRGRFMVIEGGSEERPSVDPKPPVRSPSFAQQTLQMVKQLAETDKDSSEEEPEEEAEESFEDDDLDPVD